MVLINVIDDSDPAIVKVPYTKHCAMPWVSRKNKPSVSEMLISYSKAFQGWNKTPSTFHYPVDTGGLSAGSLWPLTQTVLSFAWACPTPTPSSPEWAQG